MYASAETESGIPTMILAVRVTRRFNNGVCNPRATPWRNDSAFSRPLWDCPGRAIKRLPKCCANVRDLHILRPYQIQCASPSSDGGQEMGGWRTKWLLARRAAATIAIKAS
jgi:hypothetical protein